MDNTLWRNEQPLDHLGPQSCFNSTPTQTHIAGFIYKLQLFFHTHIVLHCFNHFITYSTRLRFPLSNVRGFYLFRYPKPTTNPSFLFLLSSLLLLLSHQLSVSLLLTSQCVVSVALLTIKYDYRQQFPIPFILCLLRGKLFVRASDNFWVLVGCAFRLLFNVHVL